MRGRICPGNEWMRDRGLSISVPGFLLTFSEKENVYMTSGSMELGKIERIVQKCDEKVQLSKNESGGKV